MLPQRTIAFLRQYEIHPLARPLMGENGEITGPLDRTSGDSISRSHNKLLFVTEMRELFSY